MLNKFYRLCLLAIIASVPSLQANELEVGSEGSDVIPLMPGKPYLHVMHNGKSIKVMRVQDPDYELRGYFAKTGRKCPPFCIGPIKAAESVATFGEAEVFEFMEQELRDGKGMLIDARTPEWYKRGTIPGSVNYPFTLLSKDADDAEMVDILQTFGAKRRSSVGMVEAKLEEMGFMGGEMKTSKWDFTNAKVLVLWCNGPACGQSPRAINGLLNVGYPPAKLKYYRGGMQMWQVWGLTTVEPES